MDITQHSVDLSARVMTDNHAAEERLIREWRDSQLMTTDPLSFEA